MDLLSFLGILSGVIVILGTVPYVVGIYRGKTKPERGSYWIWFALSVITFFAQIASGGSWSAILPGTFALSSGLIALLSIKHGYGRFSLRDTISLMVAAAGIVAWWISGSPTTAIVIAIGVSAVGSWLTITKTWVAPNTENALSWVLMTAASLFSLLSVGSFDFGQLLYPGYQLAANGAIALIIIYRRPRAILRSRSVK